MLEKGLIITNGKIEMECFFKNLEGSIEKAVQELYGRTDICCINKDGSFGTIDICGFVKDDSDVFFSSIHFTELRLTTTEKIKLNFNNVVVKSYAFEVEGSSLLNSIDVLNKAIEIDRGNYND